MRDTVSLRAAGATSVAHDAPREVTAEDCLPGGTGTGCCVVVKAYLSSHGPRLPTSSPHAGAGGARSWAICTNVP